MNKWTKKKITQKKTGDKTKDVATEVKGTWCIFPVCLKIKLNVLPSFFNAWVVRSNFGSKHFTKSMISSAPDILFSDSDQSLCLMGRPLPSYWIPWTKQSFVLISGSFASRRSLQWPGGLSSTISMTWGIKFWNLNECGGGMRDSLIRH